MLTPDILVDRLARLRVYRSGGPPALYQPITLLWAIGRARRGEPRLASWPQVQREVGDLLTRYGRGETAAVYYPVAALHGAGLWELDAEPGPVPSAHGSSVPQRWFDDHQPNGGLVNPVYALVRESPEARAAAVGVLVETYFTGTDATGLLGELGLSDSVRATSFTAGGHGSGRPQGSPPGDWTEAENRAIVDDYLAMLSLESAGQPYSKTGHRNALIESIGGTRSPGSVERKHQNISAVMLQLGLPYIKGYKPLPNIQHALLTEVRRRLDADPAWFAELQPQQQSPAEARFSAALRRVAVPEMPPEPRGRKVDYGLLQEESKRVGDRGEQFVFNFEKAAPEFYTLEGDLDTVLTVEPVTYRARPA